MIHVKYKLDCSDHHGVGLFADESILKNAVIYTASPVLDVNVTQEQFDLLDEKEKAEVRYWGFFDEPTQKWHVDFDVSHFMNHSYDANTTQHPDHDEAYLIADRDIQKGEELTQNYLEFETEEDLAERGISSR